MKSTLRAVSGKAMRTTAAVLLPILSTGLSLPPCAAFGQPAAETPSFEVISVKASKPVAGSPGMTPSPGGFVAANVTIKMLIRAAYRLDESSMTGGPGWLDSERYDVAAKTAQRTSEDQLRLMLQTLLADRFRLRVHREAKAGRAYSLAIASKDRPNLRAVDAAGCSAAAPTANPCGRFRKSARGRITGERVSMGDFARFLSNVTGVPISDHTGLPGVFDIHLEATVDDGVNAARTRESSESLPEAGAPSLFTALREQLGLKLEPTRGSTEILVIDRAERPSGN